MSDTAALTAEFDLGFQEKIVRLLYQDDSFASSASEYLKPELFENHVHRWVVQKIAWCLKNLGCAITPTILNQEKKKDVRLGLIRKEQLPAFKEFFATKIFKPVPDRSYIKREVNNFVCNQNIQKALMWTVEDGLAKHDFQAIKDVWAKAIDTDITGDDSLGSFTGKTFRERSDYRMNAQVQGISTGLPSLDALMISGGLVPGQIGVILGSTGRGKSNKLIDIAASNVMEGVPTIYYTCELDQRTIETRFDARFTGIPLKLLKSNPGDVMEAWEKLGSKVADNLIVKEYPMGTLTVSMIKTHIKRLERHGFYPKLLVIDYADVMKSQTVFANSSYETQGEIYKDLKGLAMAMKLVIWTGTQANRDGMKREQDDEDVTLASIAESAKKVFIADVVAALNQTKAEKLKSLMRIGILKNRNGPAEREIPITVDHSVVRFVERHGGALEDLKEKAKAPEVKKKFTSKHHAIQATLKEKREVLEKAKAVR